VLAFTERGREGGANLEISEELSYALRDPQKGMNSRNAILAAAPRRLTPRECERLQGFPDDWTRYAADGLEIADSPRYRMLGNAVTVPVAEWIGRRILEAST
jgi:DNA (cytosine-5)-methyltransferase 1